MEKHGLGSKNNDDNTIKTPTELGKRSIFYDEDWNPTGSAPSEQFRNIPYNPSTFVRKGPDIDPIMHGLENVLYPK
ncbi:Aim4p NDAI_0C05520 [Naumovozyma dairenensis CBS 421]|uniref:Uncharacterized protein n=1 Tax=Naumovozyma dairenensis (strain ATCC 10597 / BCRC 20456 / CBS 421 / NBRC 0211 / NRRL Y-12639) TaxID=1071378 RepID=G0W8V0_NAUDC|nr:hypothetical protein NDAI_0C05520 [Naumovozyma dairenensis CBS 421]CCD24211.1 hypothetical protein NDAI_0C05520 [Naumovozyma dairenensis CBS 421]